VRKIFLFAALVVIGIVGYFGYRLLIEPKVVVLPPIDKPPFYSVSYVYSIQTLNPVTFLIGGKDVSTLDLGKMFADDMQAIKSAGFGGVKVSFNFKGNNYLEGRVALKAAQAGLYPLATLAGGDTKPDMDQWKTFVKNVVSSNKYIYFWEIWNEPSMDASRYGSPEEFVQLLKVTYPIIKAANPKAKVMVTLSAEARDNTGFEDQVLALGGGDYFDILGFHPYAANPYLQENLIKEAITREQALVAKYNNRWPLWIGEIGQPASEVGEAQQANLARMVYQEALDNHIPLTWLSFTDERLPNSIKIGDGSGWGLIRNDGSKRPVYNTVINFIKNNPL
jgi:hypothetical protein